MCFPLFIPGVMKNFIQHIRQSDLVKNSAKLLGANVLAQFLGILVFPILTRFYSPEDFGLFNLFVSIGGILVILSTADYQNAVVLPKEDDKAYSVSQAAFVILFSVTLLVAISTLFSAQIASLFKTPSLGDWYWLMPFFVLFSGAWSLLNYLYTRFKQFSRLGSYMVSQTVTSAGAKIVLGKMGWTNGGLLLSSVFAPFLSLCVNVARGWNPYLKKLLRVDVQACRSVAKEYANFPKFSLPHTVVNYLSGNMLSLLLTPIFGLAQIGFWGMAMTLAFRPLNMIATSLYQPFYQKTADAVNARRVITPFFRSFVSKTIMVIVPVFTLLYFALPWLVKIILGEEWGETAQIIRVMLPWLAVICVVTTIQFIPDVFGKQKMVMMIEILYLILRLAAVASAYVTHSFFTTIVLYCGVSSLVLIGQGIWMFHLVKQYDSKICA